jgi:hypothetical protein
VDLVIFGGKDTGFVVSVVLVVVVLAWTCCWVLMEMTFLLGVAFEVVLGGKRCFGLGGGRPPGEGMAALCLVNLTGVHGGWWLVVGSRHCFYLLLLLVRASS